MFYYHYNKHSQPGAHTPASEMNWKVVCPSIKYCQCLDWSRMGRWYVRRNRLEEWVAYSGFQFTFKLLHFTKKKRTKQHGLQCKETSAKKYVFTPCYLTVETFYTLPSIFLVIRWTRAFNVDLYTASNATGIRYHGVTNSLKDHFIRFQFSTHLLQTQPEIPTLPSWRDKTQDKVVPWTMTQTYVSKPWCL